MNNPVSLKLRQEAQWLRSFATRLDALAQEWDNGGPGQAIAAGSHSFNGTTNRTAATGEFARMTQAQAILKALQAGPQTTKELFDRLNAGGQNFAKVTYITAILGKLKDKIERTEDKKKVQLKEEVRF